MNMFSRAFWLDTLERAIKTFAQSLLAVLVGGTTVLTVDWPAALLVAGTATLISVLTSIASSRVKDENTASLV